LAYKGIVNAGLIYNMDFAHVKQLNDRLSHQLKMEKEEYEKAMMNR